MIKYFRLLFLILSIDPNIILITLDGIRWQEIFNGTDYKLSSQNLFSQELIPNIYNHFFINGVVIGDQPEIFASGPLYISLPGYLEITNGKKNWRKVITSSHLARLCR